MSQIILQSRRQSPVLLVVLAIASVHVGTAIAKGLFSQVSPSGVVTLRLVLGAMVLLAVSRPRWRQYSAQEYRLVILLGIATGLMNALFYLSIAYIPIGVAVTLEFIGPLGVALSYSRRGLDLVWVGMAAVGVVLLSPLGGIALHPVGVVLALGAGIFWAIYIVVSAQVAKGFSGITGVAIAIAAGAVLLLPVGIATDGLQLLSPAVLVWGLMVAILSSAIPYSLEILALKRMPVKVFGVLMSLEPAVASVLALVILGEQLSWRMVTAIALICIASAGSALQSEQPT